mgnify:CR=1 FL=1
MSESVRKEQPVVTYCDIGKEEQKKLLIGHLIYHK